MPFHLTPLSRRQFVRGAALAGAGLMLPRGAFADTADESCWALFSDPHIDADANLVFRDVLLAEHLRSCVQQVKALAEKPAGVFVNGDCARLDGQSGDYSTFLSLLKPLSEAGFPLHMTLGNHDHRERFWAEMRKNEAVRPVQNKHVSVVESRFANWVLLDSLRQTNVTPGLLDKEQREWLIKTLDAHADKPALVMVHHNPAAGSLLDTAELMEILTSRKQVKALIFGHTHTWELKEKDGLHLLNLPAIAYPFAPEQPTGWVDCRLSTNGATFELRAHDEKHPKHGEKKELKWRI